MTLIFPLDHDHGRPAAELVDELGWLAADLNELTVRYGMPVPVGFTFTTAAGSRFGADGWTDELEAALHEGLGHIESATGRKLGASTEPLLVSVRPAATVDLPGLAPPVLDIGIDDAVIEGLTDWAGERFAHDTAVLFVERFATAVLGAPETPFEELRATARRFAAVDHDDELPELVMRLLVDRAREVASAFGDGVPEVPIDQVRKAVRSSMAAWSAPSAVAVRNRRGVAHEPGPAVTVQAMVYGNLGPRSGSGVVWSHDPATGEPGLSGTVQRRSQGSGELPGAHETLEVADVAEHLPELLSSVRAWSAAVHADDRDAVGLDLTVERGTPWVLRSRRGAPSGAAALRIAVDEVTAQRLGRDEALRRLSERHIEDVLHGSVDTGDATVLATGLGASPGAASGVLVLGADDAAARAAAGESVILVKQETSPEDVHGMSAAAGILTTRGGLASHAAVVARGWGTPAVCGADGIELLDGAIRVGGVTIAVGEPLSIDGTSGQVLQGEVSVSEGAGADDLDVVLGWADEVRAGHLAVRANADTGADAARARDFGAEGIGLCRTEHMFLADDRLPIMRDMILADSPAGEAKALRKLRRAQKADFIDLLEAMDGLPVT
ncbi:MAG: PEP-utilizing enzyme, partial [Actinomycetota bacterium]